MNIESYRKNKGKEPIIINLNSDEEPIAPPHQHSMPIKLEEGKLVTSSAPQTVTNIQQPTVIPAEPSPVSAPTSMQVEKSKMHAECI